MKWSLIRLVTRIRKRLFSLSFLTHRQHIISSLLLLYTQLFNLLCTVADDKYGGRLPTHVRCLLDEFANIGQIPNFEKLIATIRSREISASIVLQSKSQLLLPQLNLAVIKTHILYMEHERKS